MTPATIIGDKGNLSNKKPLSNMVLLSDATELWKTKQGVWYFEGEISSIYWLVVKTVNHLVNHGPIVANRGVTSKKKYTEKKPNVNTFRVFRSICNAYICKEDRSKLGNKTRACLFVEYDDITKA